MLRLGSRVVEGFALGAAASSFAQASADLQNQVTTPVVSAGDVYYNADVANYRLDYSDAVKAYQAAGQAGASSVGPEIDAAGASSTTQPLTQQAYTLNGQLAALQPSGAPDPTNDVTAAYFNQADADQARSLVVNMIDLYDQAIVAGAQAAGQSVPTSGQQPTFVPGQGAAASSPASSSGSSSWLWLIPVAAVGGIFVAVISQKGARHAYA